MPKTTKTPATPTAAEKKGTDESRSDRSRTPKTPGGHTEVRTPRTLSIGSRRRPYEFDSTLGYPCEGPVKLMGWNANGLCDKLHFAASLRKARTGREGRAGVDAIMVQEHKWKEGSYALAQARRAATTGGWELLVRGSDGARGGTAILVDKHSTHV